MFDSLPGISAPLLRDLPQLAEKWVYNRLNQLVDERGICYGVVQPGHPIFNGVPMLRVNEIRDRTIFIDEVTRIHPNIDSKHRRSKLRGGEVLLTLVGANFGEAAVAPPEVAGWNVARAIAVIPIRPDAHPRWVCLALQSPVVRHFIRNWASTTAQPTLNLSDVAQLPIPMPPLPERLAIVSVLAALDDKIELNRRTNVTLEQTISALFRSWFVDFDPVVAKAAKREPAHLTPVLAAHFPDSFQDSELGPVPKRWSVGSINDLGRYVNGRAFTKGATGTGRMVIRIAELNSGPTASTVYNEVTAEPENIAQPGDLLFAWSGSLDVYRWYREEALINQHIFKVVCEEYPQWFVHHALRNAMPFFQDVAADKATTMGHIKREHLSEARLALPPAQLITELGRIVDPLYAAHLANNRESQTLTALRDTLLPKLLSGEIRVKGAEKLIESQT